MFDAPIAEVSGACFAGDRVVIVGDADTRLAWTRWNGQPGDWVTLDLEDLADAPKKIGQFEAVEHLRDDIVVVLCEEPALLVAVDLSDSAIVGVWHLNVDLKGLAKSWRKDPNSHGEGLFFGDDRVYVIKEKRPATIIEFGLEGQESAGEPVPGKWTPPPPGELSALASWDLDLDDVSDACVRDGQVWLLSDQNQSYGPLGGVPIPLGLEKPEGLTRTPEGNWLVALDNEDGRAALHVLD